ncbi:MAG: hypothetical protein IMZ44_03740 [Planctomycetes bacterium]|nr:hypothetical protein [Planctomycetota bacterium]
MGVIALRGAVLKAQNPESPIARNIPASRENIAFAKANISVLGPKLAEADAVGMKMLMKR